MKPEEEEEEEGERERETEKENERNSVKEEMIQRIHEIKTVMRSTRKKGGEMTFAESRDGWVVQN